MDNWIFLDEYYDLGIWTPSRAYLEEESQENERANKEKRENEKRMNEFEMLKYETMIQKSKCSSSRENTNAKDGKISKDASEIDNNVFRASHDKDNITEAFKQNEDKYLDDIIQLQAKNKDLENIVCKMGQSSQTLRMLTNEQTLYRENTRKLGLGYKDPCFLRQVVAYNPKLYDAHVLRQEFVKLDMHDTEEILNDAEETEVLEMLKMFELMESEVDETSKKHEILQNKIDHLLEANVANDVKNLVMHSRVEANQCDEVKIKLDVDEIETQNIELEHQVASLLKENEHLKLVYKNLFDSIKKTRFDHILSKVDSSPSSIVKSNIFKLEKESGEKKNLCENAKCELQTKIVELEKVLTQQTKDFDNVKLELSN
ncbi:hypothetical protein Tco_0296090 [Tanacetum coccineum]